MAYLKRLVETDDLLCLGLDPVPGRLPLGMDSGVESVETFLTTLLEAALAHDLLPSTLKPNLAYFEQFGWRGFRLLEELVAKWSDQCLIILDAKRGDIGRSSAAYAKTCFETLAGDSVTLHPWMGPESVKPFVEYFPAKGGYLLLRTSNPGSDLLQGEGWPLLLREIDQYDASGGLGFVVGATRPSELEYVVKNDSKNRPLLIPGVGAQGGTSEEVMTVLRQCSEPRVHRVNVSSGILYTHEQPGKSFPEANLEALRRYRSELRVGD